MKKRTWKRLVYSVRDIYPTLYRIKKSLSQKKVKRQRKELGVTHRGRTRVTVRRGWVGRGGAVGIPLVLRVLPIAGLVCPWCIPCILSSGGRNWYWYSPPGSSAGGSFAIMLGSTAASEYTACEHENDERSKTNSEADYEFLVIGHPVRNFVRKR